MRRLNKGEGFLKIDGEPAVVITGWIALEGTSIIVKKKSKELTEFFYKDIIKEAVLFENSLNTDTALKIAGKYNTLINIPVSDGGILAALWELGRCTGKGFEIDIRKIPVRQETIEICEYFGINPYELLSNGSLLTVTREPVRLIDEFKDAGVNAVCVGYMKEGKDLHIRCADHVSCLNRPNPDSINLL